MCEQKKVIICDDEEDALLLIREYIAGYPQLQLIAECSNGIEAVSSINRLQPDLVFLDIQMPALNGFEVLQQLHHLPRIIFATAFDAYALKAFDSNAVDYLLKPYSKRRFSQAIDKVLHQSALNLESIKKLSDSLQSGHAAFPEKVLVESGTRMMAVSVNDIYWIEADGDYSRIHTTQKFYLGNYGMNILEQKLNPHLFVRIHRSAIVNMNRVKEVRREAAGYFVVLQNGITHKVGRSYTETIKRFSL